MEQNAKPAFDHPLPVKSRRWCFGSAVFDERTLELTIDGEPVEIERKPSEVLLYLLLHAGEVVTKDELLDAIWPRRVLTETALTKCIARLREALADTDQSIIKTLYGLGYRLITPVRIEASLAPPLPRFDFSPGDSPPQRSHWKLLRRLGGGSRGEAWLAQHDKTSEMRVFKFAIDASALVSLKREITLFRLLNEALDKRARIVKVLDWNLEQPPCFIEMEFLPSGSLEDWFAANGGFATSSTQQRVELAAQIAEALAAAHSVGVLHKDLKPANILIDSENPKAPQVRLGDFGSGGITDPNRLDALHITRLGFTGTFHTSEFSGTLTYLAPEVVAGQTSTVQTDIYALGVLLYQLIVGDLQRPLAPGWERDVHDEFLREDIAAAADIDPSCRLGDAGELARRLRTLDERRLLRESEQDALAAAACARAEAHHARQETERLRARRTGMQVAVAVLLVALFAVGLISLDAQRARSTAEVEAKRANAVSDFLNNDVLSVVSSGNNPVKNLTVKELLDTASQQADKRFVEQPPVAAAVDFSLGMSYYRLEHEREALERWQKALSFSEQSEDGIGALTLRLAGNLVWIANDMGSLPAQMSVSEQILKKATERFGGLDARVLTLRQHVAGGHAELGRWSEAAAELEAVILDREATGAPDTNMLARAHASLGYTLADLAEFARSEEELKHAIAMLASMKSDSQIPTARARIRLGEVLAEVGRFSEAEQEISAAEAIVKTWVSGDNGFVVQIKYRRALLQLYQNHPSEAQPLFDEAIALLASWKTGEADASAPLHEGVALTLQLQGHLREALQEMQDALSRSVATLGATHPKSRRIEIELADLLRISNRMDDAMSMVYGAQPLRFDDLPPTHPLNALLLREQGLLDEANENIEEADEKLTRARGILSAVYGDSAWRTRIVMNDLYNLTKSRTSTKLNH